MRAGPLQQLNIKSEMPRARAKRDGNKVGLEQCGTVGGVCLQLFRGLEQTIVVTAKVYSLKGCFWSQAFNKLVHCVNIMFASAYSSSCVASRYFSRR